MSNIDIFTYQNGQLISHVVQPAGNLTEQAIAAKLATYLNNVEAFIAANPGGAVLTAGQTLFVAKMLACLARITLGLIDQAGQTQ